MQIIEGLFTYGMTKGNIKSLDCYRRYRVFYTKITKIEDKFPHFSKAIAFFTPLTLEITTPNKKYWPRGVAYLINLNFAPKWFAHLRSTSTGIRVRLTLPHNLRYTLLFSASTHILTRYWIVAIVATAIVHSVSNHTLRIAHQRWEAFVHTFIIRIDCASRNHQWRAVKSENTTKGLVTFIGPILISAAP